MSDGREERLARQIRSACGGYNDDDEPVVVCVAQMRDRIAELESKLAAAESQPAVPEWRPIETAPHNKPVLIHYKNGCGKGRTIKAEFIPANTIEASGEYDDHCEYNEALDNYFWPEGWHEMIDNWGEYSHVVVNETPTHWMPLPEPPAGDSHE